MSQPAETTTPPPTRYRYFTVAPRTLDLPADVLLAHVPAEVLSGSAPTHSVTVTCSDIFRTNIPRVSATRLREWLPDAIVPDAQLPEWLPIPVAKIARAYRPETRREALPNPDQPDAAETRADAAHTPIENQKSKIENPPTPSSWKRILKPVLGPSVEELQKRHHRLRNPDPEAKAETKPEGEAAPKAGESPATPLPIPPSSSKPPKSEIAPARIGTLQELFHTDKQLTLQDVAELASAFPGLQGCVPHRRRRPPPLSRHPGRFRRPRDPRPSPRRPRIRPHRDHSTGPTAHPGADSLSQRRPAQHPPARLSQLPRRPRRTRLPARRAPDSLQHPRDPRRHGSCSILTPDSPPPTRSGWSLTRIKNPSRKENQTEPEQSGDSLEGN